MSAHQDSAELLPCPFCQRHALPVERHNPMSGWRWSVDCQGSTCGTSGPVESSKVEAITAWNTRADTTLREQRDELLEALEGLVGEELGGDSHDNWRAHDSYSAWITWHDRKFARDAIAKARS